MSRVALVADDLTGATDTAVQFAERGWPTLVGLRPGDEGSQVPGLNGLLAVPTDVRASDPESAAAATADAVRRLVAGGADRLYLKVDSTMRGTVAAQIEGALAAWSERHADAVVVCCPAYPAMGRVVRGNEVSAGGRPLESGPAGRDPVTPVLTSDMGVLLPGSLRAELPTSGDPAAMVDALERAAARARVVTIDAVDDQDLERLADAASALGERVVIAGSAGLAGPMAARWRPDPGTTTSSAALAPDRAEHAGPVLVLLTSLHEVARDQLRGVLHDRDDVHLVTPTLGDDLQVHLDDVDPKAAVIVVAAPESEPGEAADGALVARALADRTADLRTRLGARAVVVVGGDGARALARRWDASGIEIHGAVAEGVPHGVLVGGEADGLTIVTKAGGFGEPDTLVRAVRAAERLSTPVPHRRKDRT